MATALRSADSDLSAEGHDIQLPYRDFADDLDAVPFVQEIVARIQRSDRVIAVLEPGDQSVAVEVSIAAGLRLPVTIIHDAGAPVPRIIAGLPGVDLQSR